MNNIEDFIYISFKYSLIILVISVIIRVILLIPLWSLLAVVLILSMMLMFLFFKSADVDDKTEDAMLNRINKRQNPDSDIVNKDYNDIPKKCENEYISNFVDKHQQDNNNKSKGSL